MTLSTKKKNPEKELLDKIGRDADQKIKANKKGKEIMFGMGVFGVVGFSIAIPTLLGTFLGLFLDQRTDSSISYTLTFLFLGLVMGCLSAWRWVKESSQDDS